MLARTISLSLLDSFRFPVVAYIRLAMMKGVPLSRWDFFSIVSHGPATEQPVLLPYPDLLELWRSQNISVQLWWWSTEEPHRAVGRKETWSISQGGGKPWEAQSRWSPKASPSTRHPMLHLMHLFNKCIGQSSDGAVVNEVVHLAALLTAMDRLCYGHNLRITSTHLFIAQ